MKRKVIIATVAAALCVLPTLATGDEILPPDARMSPPLTNPLISNDGEGITGLATTGEWGSVPMSFDTATGVLTLGAGTTSGAKTLTAVLSAASIGTGTQAMNLKEIHFESGFTFGADTPPKVFENLRNLERLVGLENVDISLVNPTNFAGWFAGDKALQTFTFPGSWDVSKVTSIASFFLADKALTSVDTSAVHFSSLKNVSELFENSSIKTINFDGLSDSPINDISSMFSGTTNTDEIDLSPLDLSGVTKANDLLNLSYASTVNLGNLDVTKLTTSQNMLGQGSRYKTHIQFLTVGPNFRLDPTMGLGYHVNPDNPNQQTENYLWRLQSSDHTVLLDVDSLTLDNDVFATYPGTYSNYYDMNLSVHSSTIYTGNTWDPIDNFDFASDSFSGQSLLFEKIDVEGSVDTSVVGNNYVNYILNWDYSNMASQTAIKKQINVRVIQSQAQVFGQDLIRFVDDPMPDDSEFLAHATDDAGDPIGVTLDKSKVDMSQAGDYDVLITADNGRTKTVQVHVVESLSLTVPPTNNFGEYNLGDSNPILPWDTTNKVEITASPDKNWDLTVSMNSSDTLSPYMKVGNASITTTPLRVTSGTGPNVVSDTVSSANFLKVDYQGVDKIGDYTGTINWQLAPTTKEVAE